MPFLVFAVVPYLAAVALASGLKRSRWWARGLLVLTVVLSLAAGPGCPIGGTHLSLP